MMKLQSFVTPIVSASLAHAAFMSNSHPANLFAPFADRFDEVFPPIGIFAPFSHPSRIPYSRSLYQLSYRGTLYEHDDSGLHCIER